MPRAASARYHGSSMKPRIFYENFYARDRHLHKHPTQKTLHIALLGAVQQLSCLACALPGREAACMHMSHVHSKSKCMWPLRPRT